MAVVLEGSRFVKLRWDLSDDDFKRIWTFCALLILSAAVYAFADSGGTEGFGRFFHSPTLASEREAGTASAKTAASLIRWVPMVFFLFVSAQAFQFAAGNPVAHHFIDSPAAVETGKETGQAAAGRARRGCGFPVSFAVVLFAASVHHNENDSFFWGLCVLLAWPLWLRRPRRFGTAIWVGTLALAVLLGYSGARGIGVVQRYVDSLNVQWIAQLLGRNRTDPSRSRTQIGEIGRIKTSTRIVIRLKPESGNPPDYLREASYTVYRSQVWLAGRTRSDFTGVEHAATNENTWPLQADKTNASRIGIECYLEGRERNTGNARGLLPLPSGSARAWKTCRLTCCRKTM